MRRNKAPWLKGFGDDVLFFDSPRDRRLAISRRVVVYVISIALLLSALAFGASVVRAGEDIPDYSRSSFADWLSHGEGCDTRDIILVEESLVPYECNDEVGEWFSVWDGDTITNPATMDIDHHVALKEAWESGAWAWTDDERAAFANDPANLNAVSSGVNRQKRDHDPAEWLPRYEVCAYLAQWVEVKDAYGLTYDEAEQAAIDAQACDE